MRKIKWNRIRWNSGGDEEWERDYAVQSVFTVAVVPKELADGNYGINIGVVVKDKENRVFQDLSECLKDKKPLIGLLMSYNTKEEWSIPVVIQCANGSTPNCPTSCIFCYIHPKIVAGDKRPKV